MKSLARHSYKYSRQYYVRFRDGVNKALANSTDTNRSYVAKFPHLFVDVAFETSAQLEQHINFVTFWPTL